MERVVSTASTSHPPPPHFQPLPTTSGPPHTVITSVYQFKRVLALKLARDGGVLREDRFRCNQ